MAPLKQNWLDRALGAVAPRVQLRRTRARIADLVLRHYEGAASGRRTQNWNRSGADGRSAMAPAAGRVRAVARDLVRNNPYAEAAVATIVDHTVGWGLTAKPVTPNQRALGAWKAWTAPRRSRSTAFATPPPAASFSTRTGSPSACSMSLSSGRPLSQVEFAFLTRPVAGEIAPGMPMPTVPGPPSSASAASTSPRKPLRRSRRLYLSLVGRSSPFQ